MVLVLLHAYNRATGYTCRSYPVAEQEGLEHLAEEGGVLVDGLLDDDVAVADRQAAAVLQVQQRRLEVLQQRQAVKVAFVQSTAANITRGGRG